MSNPGNGGGATIPFNSIEISDGLIVDIGHRLFGNSALFNSNPFNDSYTSSGLQLQPYRGESVDIQQMALLTNYSLTRHGATLCLMTGDMPSSIDNLVIADYQSQILWACSSTPVNGIGDQSQVFNLSRLDSNPITLSTNYYPAIASGTASWVLFFCTYYNNALGKDNPTAIHSFMGTVGVPGSGSDLSLPDTNIYSGVLYCIRDLKIELPTIWDFI